MTMKQRAVLIVNAKSRRGDEWFKSALQTLQKSEKIELVRYNSFRKPSDVLQETDKAISERIPLVIVGGGDGTLSAAAPRFIGSASVFGILPLGTGNQFAYDLGIVADVETSCRVLTDGKEAAVDIGVIGDGHFLTVATVGLTTLIAKELTNAAKRKFGRISYLFALVKALQRVRPFRATLVTEEGERSFETLQIVIGNGRFHGGPFPLSPDACITNGKLTVYALEGTSRWEFLKLAVKLPGGHQAELQNVSAFETKGGVLKSTPLQRVTVDGETRLRTPVKFGIVSAALRVMVPQEFQG